MGFIGLARARLLWEGLNLDREERQVQKPEVDAHCWHLSRSGETPVAGAEVGGKSRK